MLKHLCTFIFVLLTAFGLVSLVSDYGETAPVARGKSKAKSAIKTQNRKVSSGDTVYGILKRQGFNNTQRNLALAQSPIPRGFVLAPGDTYQVVKSPESNKLVINFFDRFQNIAYSFWRKPDTAGVDISENILRKEVASVKGVVKGSLIQTIRNLVGDEMLAYRFLDAYVLDHNIRKELQRGAKFAATFEKLYSDKTFIRFGEVLRAELEIGNRNVVREFRTTKNGGLFLDAKDNHDSRPFYAPVDYIRVSSVYQPRRFHPVKKRRIAHMGVDFELPEGEPIYAVKAGTVVRHGRNRASGRYVVLRHSNGYESFYNHMSAISENIYKGLQVNVGAPIGKIGCTGYCTKPHLHFAVKKHGRFVNPAPLIKRYSYSQRNVGRGTVDIASAK